jgi:membrane AbrB-like protein
MAAAAGMAVSGRSLTVPVIGFALSQGFIGALVARGLGPDFFSQLCVSWPYILGGTIWAIVLGGLLSYRLHRLRVFPGSTALWSLSPGSAAIMALMSADYGGDVRLVAFAQYFRVLLVSLAAAIVSGLWLPAPNVATAAPLPPSPALIFPPLWGADFPVTVAAVLIGLFLAKRLRVPGGQLLLPMILTATAGAVLGTSTLLPPWLLTVCYALVGWRIGLSFSKETLRPAFKAIPALFTSIVLMIVGCALFGVVMVEGAGLSPMTAYLASSPGGLDAVTVIAAGADDVDLSIVMAMQASRLFLVISLAPLQARLLVRLSGGRPDEPAP